MRAPLDHVAPGFERVTVPPDGRPLIVCAAWPECQCGDDCPHVKNRAADRVALALILATVLVAGGLLVWSFLP